MLYAESIAEDVLANTSFTASYDAGNRITNWNRAGAPFNNAQTWNYDDNGNYLRSTQVMPIAFLLLRRND